MSSPFSHTLDASNQNIPACLSSGSIRLDIINNGTYAGNYNLPFIEPALQHSLSVVEHLFTRNPFLSVREMLQRFQQYYLDSDPHLYVHRWRLFVKTINVVDNDEQINTFAQIHDTMLFLSIPEYILNNLCLIVCTNNDDQTLNAMGRVYPGLVTRQYLVNSANITALSQVSSSRKRVAEAIRSLDFVQNFSNFSTDYKMKAIALSEKQLADARRLRELYTSEALKHELTQKDM